MADGKYAQALPVAMAAVKEGQDIFKPQPDLRLFPLFLLGAQVSCVSNSTLALSCSLQYHLHSAAAHRASMQTLQ